MTRTIDPVRTRARILDAAESLFARHGFDGTSTTRIATAAGVPKGLLFYYFATKPDILGALIDERLSTDALDPTPLTVPDDPVQTLVNVGDRVLSDHAASDVLREIIWHESRTRPEARAALTRYRHALHDTVERALLASLPAPVDGDAVRAAAAAWTATITARPLEEPAADGNGAEEAGKDDGAARDEGTGKHAHPREASMLRAIAHVLIAGLQLRSAQPGSG